MAERTGKYLEDFLWMTNPSNGKPEKILIEKSDPDQIANLMRAGYKQCEPKEK